MADDRDDVLTVLRMDGGYRDDETWRMTDGQIDRALRSLSRRNERMRQARERAERRR